MPCFNSFNSSTGKVLQKIVSSFPCQELKIYLCALTNVVYWFLMNVLENRKNYIFYKGKNFIAKNKIYPKKVNKLILLEILLIARRYVVEKARTIISLLSIHIRREACIGMHSWHSTNWIFIRKVRLNITEWKKILAHRALPIFKVLFSRNRISVSKIFFLKMYLTYLN